MSAAPRVAVIGSGVAGLTAAWDLHRTHQVTLFEADERLGGHADTHVVDGIAVDTGFIVHNERTYPTLLRLFGELGVRTQDSEMSLSVSASGLEYAGAHGLSGLFPTWANLRNPAYLRMLAEIRRFHRRARRLLSTGSTTGTGSTNEPDETLGEFLERGRFSAFFRQHFVQALVAAVWSCDPDTALDYPARYLFTFLQHHGMLRVFGSPQWRTVTGGSHEYVARIGAALPDVRTGTKVTSVLETADGVEVTDGNGARSTFDAIVVATHPGQALSMLASPTAAQRELLAAMPYRRNTAQLHTDTSVLPRARRAWASWNLLDHPGHGLTISYDLTRLMRLPSPDGRRFMVTLGGTDLVDPALVIDTMEYEHPVYTPDSVAARARLSELDTTRIRFAGAWQGWGFHEDGARSGAAAARRIAGLGPETTRLPSVYRTRIDHVRRTPIAHSFRYRSTSWVVDLDHLPSHGVLGTFESRDHLGSADLSIRQNVENFLATQGIRADGRILMTANARAFGYCFNPISVFWCHDRGGRPAATVVEVHNTYGDRHAYLVETDERGRGTVAKQMYVSPFHGTDGVYEVLAPVPSDRLHVAIRLRTDEGDVFTASMTGQATPGGVLRAAPAAALAALRIRRQGIGLWARGLAVRPRPVHPRQEGVQ